MTETPERSFAELLDYLFQEVRPKGRGSFTYAEVSQGIRETSGVAISASAIQQLRTGTNTNPKMQTIRALAGFFGVPPGYFFDEEVAERARAEIKVVAAMRDQEVRRVALRANGLSTSSLQMLNAVIDQARRLEGMPDDSDSSELLDDE
ncbi:Secondary metabolite protein [Streptomyces sp. NBC_01190]|uniref:Secondary metabolite protein n=1 Tax=Streptomyces sp. NBC_01190 TaxID=2903767 RepID=UPI00386A41D4|nr:helix-turn-helix domain-containing protein [Streptomyces sp. NBC_01190]